MNREYNLETHTEGEHYDFVLLQGSIEEDHPWFKKDETSEKEQVSSLIHSPH